MWLGGSNETVSNLIVTCMGTTQRFWLKNVGSPSPGVADVLGSLQLFLKRLGLSILWQTPWLAERLLLPDPVAITSERWGNNNSYHFSAFTLHLHCAKHFHTCRPMESAQSSWPRGPIWSWPRRA